MKKKVGHEANNSKPVTLTDNPALAARLRNEERLLREIAGLTIALKDKWENDPALKIAYVWLHAKLMDIYNGRDA